MKRHLLIAFTLLVLVVLGVLARNASTVRLMIQNARMLQEGAAEAKALTDPEAVLNYVLAHADDVSILIVEDADTLARFGRYAAMPLAGMRLQALARGAEGMVATVEVEESVAAFALPEDLATFAGAPCTNHQPCTLAVLRNRVAQGDRRAYTDLLLTTNSAGVRPGIPHLGYLLSWNNHTLNTPVADRLAAFRTMRRADLDSLARDIVQAYQRDEEGFRRREVAWREHGGLALSLREQRDLAHATFPRATAPELAALLPSTDGVHLYSDGFPGLMLAAGTRTLPTGQQRRVVAMLQHVPLAVFYHLGRTRLDRGLVLELLHNDQAVARLDSASAVASSSALTALSTR
ncbi:MAG: hypothetical protein RhofKO_37320 [Rhodothermales bacterium]